jgi:diketogulonate reductase-like aldo/keto reductase
LTLLQVSNWGTRHIQELVDAGSPLPVINQIDLHPWMRHPDIVAICEKHNIVLEAWAPLARAMRFDHPALVKVADKLKRDKAQILLRWGLQHVSAEGASSRGATC